MTLTPPTVLAALWIGWLASWMLAALWSQRTARRAGIVAELPYRIPLGVGTALLIVAHRSPLRLWRTGPAPGWALDGWIVLGIAFCWWARLHLGRLWSGNITFKEGHRVVDTGPYALVRHPIYTGLSWALIGTAAMLGTPLAVGGALLVIVSFYVKARHEERFLREELGAEAYDAYARRVPMLLPFPRPRT